MAFKVRKLNHCPWPVTVKLLESDAKGCVVGVEQTFVAHWKTTSEAERKAIAEALDEAYPIPAGRTALDNATALQRNAAYFCKLIVGWGDEVKDEAGLSIPFSTDVLAAMITGPDGMAISLGLINADSQIRYGVAPEKNSKTSPAPGESSGAGEVVTNSPTT